VNPVVGSDEGMKDGMKSDFELNVTTEDDEVVIRGNRAGLSFLSEACAKVIGKTDPSGHIHISPAMGNASESSKPLRIEFTEEDN
jgi:hypothetical protein